MKPKYVIGQWVRFTALYEADDTYTFSRGLLNFNKWKVALPFHVRKLENNKFLIKDIVTENHLLIEYLIWNINEKYTGVVVEQCCELINTDYNKYWAKLNEV